MTRNLNDALKTALEEPHKISFYEAKVIREMIMADGVMSAQERAMLEDALQKDQFDDKAYNLLSELLMRAK